MRFAKVSIASSVLFAVSVVVLAAVVASGLLALEVAIRVGTGVAGVCSLVVVVRLLPPAETPRRVSHEVLAPARLPLRRRVVGAVHAQVLAALTYRRRRAGLDPALAKAGGELKRTEMQIRFSATTAGDFHALTRSRLVAVAGRRLADRGIDPHDRDAVTAAMGARAAEIVDPAARPPRDRSARGVPVATILETLRRLENLP